MQYRSIRYGQALSDCEVVASVGSKGDSYDNALAEALNSLYKAELIRNQGPWEDIDAARARHRRAGSLGGYHPATLRLRHASPRRARSLLGPRRQPEQPGTITTGNHRHQINQPPPNPGLDSQARTPAHTMSSTVPKGASDAGGGVGVDADAPTLTPRPVHLADTGSGTTLSALLTSPFDQLISPSLHTAAHAHHLQHLAQPAKPTTPPTADDTPMSPTTRTTPTLVGERCSTSGTASQPVSTGVGLGKSLLVREKGLEPSRPKAPGPKPGASTNSATRAVRRPLYRPQYQMAECGDVPVGSVSPHPVRPAAA